MLNHSEILDTMKYALTTAADNLLSGADRQSTTKQNAKDVVTVSDIKAQDTIRKILQNQFPDSVVLSEEDDEKKREQLFRDDFSGFVIDPIDGTYNFVRDMQESALSVGYIIKGQPHVGVVYDPYKKELFYAVKGKGAYRNDVRLDISAPKELAEASVATSNSYDAEAMARNLKRQLLIYESTGTMPWVSCPGSGVLIMCWVACGRIDVYHHNGLKPWDNAAAFLIVQEAGGTGLSLDGKPVRFVDSSVIIGVSSLVTQLSDIFKGHPDLAR